MQRDAFDGLLAVVVGHVEDEAFDGAETPVDQPEPEEIWRCEIEQRPQSIDLRS